MAVDYSAPARKPRTLATPARHAAPTPQQQQRQDETVRILRRYADAAEAAIERFGDRLAGDVRLCPCGIAAVECLCDIQRAMAQR